MKRVEYAVVRIVARINMKMIVVLKGFIINDSIIRSFE